MSIRKPAPRAAVALLREAVRVAGAEMQTKTAYDLLARLEGYKNWAHFRAEQPASAQASATCPGHLEAEVADWPVWVVYTAYDPEERLFVKPFGTQLDKYADWGPVEGGEALDDGRLVLTDTQRERGLIVCKVASWFPRVDRYGYPPLANEREVAGWIRDELGWSYLVDDEGESRVETFPHDTGDDSVGTYALEVRVNPAVHAKLQALFAASSADLG